MHLHSSLPSEYQTPYLLSLQTVLGAHKDSSACGSFTAQGVIKNYCSNQFLDLPKNKTMSSIQLRGHLMEETELEVQLAGREWLQHWEDKAASVW